MWFVRSAEMKLGSEELLGALEALSVQLAGLAAACPPPLPEPAAVAVFAGDHGVHARGVAQGQRSEGRSLREKLPLG